MRILHILNEVRPSGAETMLRLAAAAWQRSGLELEVLSLGRQLGTYAPVLEEAGYLVHHQPLDPAARFLPSYLRLLRDRNYDVVHVHPERANFALATVARFVGGAGVVRTIHNNFEFAGRLRIERLMQRALLRWSGVMHVAVGESVATTERRNFRNATTIIANTFDEDRFYPPTTAERKRSREALGLKDTDFAVVLVGNCSSVKNHGSLIEALGLIKSSHIRVLHAGIEDEEQTAERRLAKHLGLSHRVNFLGRVDDVPSLLHAADCYVMPSLYEGFTIAALEAVASGLPVILADVPGLRDLRSHVPNAWWADVGASSIARALSEVVALPADERVRLGTRTATTIRERFGVDRHASAYLQRYREVTRL